MCFWTILLEALLDLYVVSGTICIYLFFWSLSSVVHTDKHYCNFFHTYTHTYPTRAHTHTHTHTHSHTQTHTHTHTHSHTQTHTHTHTHTLIHPLSNAIQRTPHPTPPSTGLPQRDLFSSSSPTRHPQHGRHVDMKKATTTEG
jgi:hypothetical protein